MNTNDLRYRKTEKNLFETYKRLITSSKKPITLVRLCDEAMINKSTFYQHYKTLEQMRLEICKTEIRIILREIEGIEDPFKNFSELCYSVADAFFQKKDYLNILFRNDILQMNRCVESEILEVLLKNENNQKNVLKIKFAVAGLTRIFVSDQSPETIDTVIPMVAALFAE